MVANQPRNYGSYSLPLRILENHIFKENECNKSAVKLHSHVQILMKRKVLNGNIYCGIL